MDLLKISPELRVMIYAHLLCTTSEIRVYKLDEWVIDRQPPSYTLDLHPNILRSCKTIHREAKNLLYTDNTFLLHWCPRDAMLPAQQLQSKGRPHALLLAQKASQIRHLAFDCTVSSRGYMDHIFPDSNYVKSPLTFFPNLRTVEFQTVLAEERFPDTPELRKIVEAISKNLEAFPLLERVVIEMTWPTAVKMDLTSQMKVLHDHGWAVRIFGNPMPSGPLIMGGEHGIFDPPDVLEPPEPFRGRAKSRSQPASSQS